MSIAFLHTHLFPFGSAEKLTSDVGAYLAQGNEREGELGWINYCGHTVGPYPHFNDAAIFLPDFDVRGLVELMNDENLRKPMQQNVLQKASDYKIDYIVPQWDVLLESLNQSV